MDINKPGIYAIRCTADGKNTTYVGQAGRSIKRRWVEHRTQLNHRCHGNAHLQNAWNKYGEKAFKFSVLEHTKSLDKREQYWLDQIKKTCPIYNISHKVRASCIGVTFSDEHRRRISNGLMGHPVSDKTRKAVSDRWKTREKDSWLTRWLKGAAFRGKKFTPEHANRISLSESKPYPEFVNEGTGERIPKGIGLGQMCKRMGLSISKMSEVKNSRRIHHKGWRLA